jgi:CheY-like chemotaxis protein
MDHATLCLLIDDDQDDQEIFLMCIQNIDKNINCLTVNNGAEAIDMLMSNTTYTPAYIFLDVNMPKMNGVDCLKELKKIKRLEYTKIFMYSTTSEHWVSKECLKLGAEDFLIKPNKASELKKKLDSIFETLTHINSEGK